MFKNSYGVYDAELVRIAKAQATCLVGNHGFTLDDADDILQTLILAGHLALARFDESVTKRSTFIYAVIHGKVLDLARHADGKKRDKRKEQCSLNTEFPEDETGETLWADVIGIENLLTEYGAPYNDRTDYHGLKMDMDEALASLPPKLRNLCHLQSVLNPEDARRAAGMAYSTHHRAIKLIRAFLGRRGFTTQARKKSGRDQDAITDNSIGTL